VCSHRGRAAALLPSPQRYSPYSKGRSGWSTFVSPLEPERKPCEHSSAFFLVLPLPLSSLLSLSLFFIFFFIFLSSSPDAFLGAVMYLWCAIPQCYDLVRVRSDGNTKRARKTKVSQLQVSFLRGEEKLISEEKKASSFPSANYITSRIHILLRTRLIRRF
jgi:hypothetical protein